MNRKKGPKLKKMRMVVIRHGGKRYPVSRFNRDVQELREKEAEKFGPLKSFRRALG